MRGLLAFGVVAVAALAAAGAVAGAAQEADAADPEPGDGIVAAVVEVGTVRYRLPAAEVVVACVDARTDAIDGTTLSVRPFVRTAGDGWLALPGFRAEAVGALAEARAGDCFALAPASFTR